MLIDCLVLLGGKGTKTSTNFQIFWDFFCYFRYFLFSFQNFSYLWMNFSKFFV